MYTIEAIEAADRVTETWGGDPVLAWREWGAAMERIRDRGVTLLPVHEATASLLRARAAAALEG